MCKRRIATVLSISMLNVYFVITIVLLIELASLDVLGHLLQQTESEGERKEIIHWHRVVINGDSRQEHITYYDPVDGYQPDNRPYDEDGDGEQDIGHVVEVDETPTCWTLGYSREHGDWLLNTPECKKERGEITATTTLPVSVPTNEPTTPDTDEANYDTSSISQTTPDSRPRVPIPFVSAIPGQVSISELMLYTRGGLHSLPQWVELYNNSKVNAVSLEAFTVEIESLNAENQYAYKTAKLPNIVIYPDETTLLVTNGARNSSVSTFTYFQPESENDSRRRSRFSAADHQHRNKVIGQVGFSLTLKSPSSDVIDKVGNLDGMKDTEDMPAWDIPPTRTEKNRRTSLLRRYDEACLPLDGTLRENWTLASEIKDRRGNLILSGVSYFGQASDIGNPGKMDKKLQTSIEPEIEPEMDASGPVCQMPIKLKDIQIRKLTYEKDLKAIVGTVRSRGLQFVDLDLWHIDLHDAEGNLKFTLKLQRMRNIKSIDGFPGFKFRQRRGKYKDTTFVLTSSYQIFKNYRYGDHTADFVVWFKFDNKKGGGYDFTDTLRFRCPDSNPETLLQYPIPPDTAVAGAPLLQKGTMTTSWGSIKMRK